MARIAIVSDIHGNLTAFEAVLADVKQTSPDIIFHGGDLPHGGSSPSEVVDRIRDLQWPGVLGNTDEMLFDPASLAAIAARSPRLRGMWDTIAEMAAFTRDALGADRIAWLEQLPRTLIHAPIALVHASPASTWTSPAPEASDADLAETYSPLGQTVAVFGHIHRAFVRTLPQITVANSGSVSMSYDGDPRASYLLIEDGVPAIRRVAYDVDREIAVLKSCGMPHADWVIRMLQSARPQMP